MKMVISSSPLLILAVRGKIYKRYISEFSNSTQLLKSCLLLIIIFQFFISDSFAQNFFPLKIGNVYQIKDNWWWVGQGGTGDSGTDYYSLAVVSDTVISGETYFSLLCNYGLQPFKNEYLYRYESLQQKLFIRIPNDTTTRLAVDFNMPAGNSYTSYITGAAVQFLSEGISTQIVLGDTHFVYSMNHTTIPTHLYQFANDIGFIKYKYYNANYGYAYSSSHFSISAIIDSKVYSPLTLSVDSLYPIEDRPIDTFPYLLTIPYTASYPALVNSFYLDVEQIRADTLVQSKRFNISKSNPKISLYLSGLATGDKLKLRATITDTSIYYNTDVYPDTGWIVMNVLPPILNVDDKNTTLSYELAQNYPNPFNPITKIRYQIPEQTLVIITVFDILGNIVEKLVNEEKIAGSYEVEFDGIKLSSGIYYYQISTGKFHQTRKMVLIK
jgi:hypothetical protein